MGVLVSILFTTMVMYIGPDKLASAASQASPPLLILSTVLIIPSYILRALRWKVILKAGSESDVRTVHAFWTTSIGVMVNFIIPLRIGDLLRAYILGKKEHINLGSSVSSVMMENTLDLIGQITFGILCLMIIFFLLPLDSTIPLWFLDVFKLIITLLGIVIALIVIGVKREEALVGMMDRILARIFLVSQRRGSIIVLTKTYIRSAKVLSQDPKLFIKTNLLTYAYLIIQIFCIWLVFQAFGYDAPLILIFSGTILLWFTFLVPAVPGYVGTFEAFWLLIFLGLGLESPDRLFAIAVAHHLLSLAAITAMGCSGAMWLGISFSQFLKSIGSINGNKAL